MDQVVEIQKETTQAPLLNIGGKTQKEIIQPSVDNNAERKSAEHKAVENMNLKFFGFTKNVDVETRTVNAIVSTENIDRDNEIVSMTAFEKSINDYLMLNPIVLGFHKYDGPPVGRCLDLKIVDDTLQAKIQFSEQANDIWELYRDGYMRAFSIGFLVNDYEYVPNEKGNGQIRKITDLELLEISVVSVPANRQALVLAKQKGLLGAKEALENIEEDTMDKEKEEVREEKETKQEESTFIGKARQVHNLVDKILSLIEKSEVSEEVIKMALSEVHNLFADSYEVSSLDKEPEDTKSEVKDEVAEEEEKAEETKEEVINDELKAFLKEKLDKTQEFFKDKLELLDKMTEELTVFTGN